MMTKRQELVFVIVLAAIFMIFTWRGLTMFFSNDDVMNMYKAWSTPAWKIWKAQVLPWMPIYRPLGTAVYRVFYTVFGFHPLPLYIFGWLLLTGNVFVGWRFFRMTASSVTVALTALSLTLVHGLFQGLYLDSGTLYDRLCFLFTALALIVYAKARADEKGLSRGRIALLCAICLAAMNSKESGAAVPAILFCYECVFLLPAAAREKRVRPWLRSIAQLYALLAAILAAFVFGRIRGTEDLISNPAYQAHPSLHLWMTNLARYLGILLYERVHFTIAATAILLIGMLAFAVFLRNTAMVFGWLFFVIAITPVALISIRPGYVLYVPYLGLGLYFATLIGLVTASPFVPVVVTALMMWVHAGRWPAPGFISDYSTWRLADLMQRNYPGLKPGAKILFVDDFMGNGYSLFFTLTLMYHDPQIQVWRLKGTPDQQPGAMRSSEFDHVFTTAADRYVELDRRDVDLSIRLNLLQDYLPGRLFDAERDDRVGYVVSGVMTSGRRGDGWWTDRSAKLKFDLYPADSRLALRFWVPDYVAKGERRILSVAVDGEAAGSVALDHVGENNVEFSVPARAIDPAGYTLLELSVDHPYRKDGLEYGVVLLRAGFEYVK